MDRTRLNYILFFVLSLLIIITYTYFFAPKTTKKPPEQKAKETFSREVESPSKTVEEREPLSEEVSLLSKGELITIRTPLYWGTIDTLGGRIPEWKLLKYRETPDENSPPVNLIKNSPPVFNTKLKLDGIEVPNPIPFNFEGEKEIEVKDGKAEIVLFWKSPEGIEVRRIYEIDSSSYLIKHTFEIRNPTKNPLRETLFIESYGKIQHNGRGKNNKDFIAMISDSIERIDKIPQEPVLLKGTINWFGFSDKYFTYTFLPEIGGETQLHFRGFTRKGFAKAEFVYQPDVIPPQGILFLKSNLYLGPLDYEILHSIGRGLEKMINYGWVGPLARPLLWLLKLLDGVFNNYGIAIIAITIIIRLAFLPLTLKSMASMKEMQAKMQELKPKIDAIKEKYKDDKAKQNAEIMKLYTSHGINPLSTLGGCLPLLVQLPIFIALYDVLLYSIELRHSSFLWIKDLSAPEDLFDIPGIGIPFRILPLAMGASWYISQKMTPTTAPGTDNMQMKIMEFMPLIFTVMFWGLPSGLILYWTVSNILSIIQQLYVNRRFMALKGGSKDVDSDRKRRKNSV